MGAEPGPRWGWGNQRRAREAEAFLAPQPMGARGRRILGGARWRALLELKRALPPYLSLSVFGSQLPGNYPARPDPQSDVDLMVVLESEVSPAQAARIGTAVERVRARRGVHFHLFLVPARTLWHKVARGDFQILNLLMIAAAVEDVGLSNALRGLVFCGAVGYGPQEPSRLRALARQTLGRAGELLDGGRLDKPLSSALHLAACSAVQAYLLCVAGVPGTLRLVPKDLPGLFREWARPPATAADVEAFDDLCRFFRRFKATDGARMDLEVAHRQLEDCRRLLEVADGVAGGAAAGDGAGGAAGAAPGPEGRG